MHCRAAVLRKCAQAARASCQSKTAVTEVGNRFTATPAGLTSLRCNATSAPAGPGKQAVSNALLVDTLDMVRHAGLFGCPGIDCVCTIRLCTSLFAALHSS